MDALIGALKRLWLPDRWPPERTVFETSLAIAPGSPEIPVEAATKDEKRRDPCWPYWKRADPIRPNAAVADQNARHVPRQTNY